MMESGEDVGLDGGYGLDGGRGGWNLEDVGPVALEFTTILKAAK